MNVVIGLWAASHIFQVLCLPLGGSWKMNDDKETISPARAVARTPGN